MDLLNNVWQWAQGLGVFTVLAGISYKAWLPPLQEWIAKKLDQRFAKQMQAADHAFQEKVRHVQSAIDRELDRARKLQDREFEALTEGWGIVHEAYWRARDATGHGYQIHDLQTMGDQQRDEFIDNLSFPKWQKQALRDIEDMADKQKAYLKAWRWSQYAEASARRQNLLMFADRKGIFIQPEIKARFDQLHTMISDALLEFELRIRDIDAPVNPFCEFVRSDRLRDAGKPLYDELEGMVRERIWSPVAPTT